MAISEKTIAFLEDVQREMYLMCPEGATVCPPYSFANNASGSVWQHKKAIIPSSVTTYANGSSSYTLSYSNVEEIIAESAAELPASFAQYSSKLIKVTANFVSSIGSRFCDSCQQLEEISLPVATQISDRICLGCTSLKTVDLPSLTSISDTTAVFVGCSALENINLGSRNNVLTLAGTQMSLSASTLLTKESLLQLGNALVAVATTYTITFAAVAWARLSATEQAIFTNKGYTITTV